MSTVNCCAIPLPKQVVRAFKGFLMHLYYNILLLQFPVIGQFCSSNGFSYNIGHFYNNIPEYLKKCWFYLSNFILGGMCLGGVC